MTYVWGLQPVVLFRQLHVTSNPESRLSLVTDTRAANGSAFMTKVVSFSSGGTITLVDGQQLQYDWLVLALGSSTSFFGIPGVKELALPFNDFKDAMRVASPSLLAQQP